MIHFVGDVMDINYNIMVFISKWLFLGRPWVAIFADITKIVTFLLKQSL